VLVQSLSFSFNDKYLASMGGQDDNRLVIWEVAGGKALCGDSTGDTANQMKFYNHSDDKIITVHNLNIKFWSVDYANKKLGFIKVNMGNIKRNFISLTIDPTDCFAYCGTKTGDFVEVLT
jgi:cilia- and flagella-associated protein 52